MTAANQTSDTLLVIGNGFDLACGLPSSFSDFFDWRFCKDEFGNLFHLQQNVSNEAIIEGIDGKTITLWDLIFWEQKQTFDRWADVENFIHYYLQNLIERTRDADYTQPVNPYKLFICGNPELVSWLESLKQRLLYSAYSRFFGFHIIGSTHTLNQGNTEPMPNRINGSMWLAVFFNELRLFEQEFDKYLSAVTLADNKGSKHYANKCTELYRQTIQKTGQPYADDEEVQVLTFNYTIPFNHSKLEELGCPSPRIFSIHGSLQSYQQTSFPRHEIIIGIDQASIGESFRAGEHDSGYVLANGIEKFGKNARIAEFPHYVLDDLNYEPVRTVVFYGHSLGEMDYSHFKRLFDELGLIQSPVSLTFFYDYHSGKAEQDIDSEQRASVERLLSWYGKTVGAPDLFKSLNDAKRLAIRVLGYVDDKTTKK